VLISLEIIGMRIALIGYGKMGQAIEEIALHREHSIVLKIDLYNREELNASSLQDADVAIEFTGPKSAFSNIMKCMESGIPVVCGSTGWLERLEDAQQYCQSRNGSLIWSSNFSVGVNIFFEINKRLAELMANQEQYEPSITEIHHTGKKDAPSGTAITLAGQIIERLTRKSSWVNQNSLNPEELGISSERKDPAPGIHRVRYSSPIDDIEITHTAHNRMGFATGAVLAAEFIQYRKGIFTMKDVLSL
jgi:4-hydroxy-tetrahydrodipicolinate reductase